MKNKRFIGFIVAASLAVGATATFAQTDQPAGQSQSGQEQQALPGQEQQSDQSQIQQDTQAQPSSPAIDEPAGAESFDKEKFLKEAAQSGMAEVNMAQIGTQKAQDPALKEAAQKIVTDHSRLNDQLKELAQKEGITLSTEVDPQKQKMMDHLSGLSGAEFDKAFATHMVQGHKKSIAKFKQAAANTQDTEVSQLAKEALPTLQEHLASVQKFAPSATAGAEVEEPAGAEPKPDDANKLDQPNQQNQDQQQPQQQEPNQSPTPDDAGQVTP